MPDNTVLNVMAGGDPIRDILKGGVKTQVVVLDLGGSGAESLLTGSMPVTGTFWQSVQPVSGTFWQTTQPVSLAGAVTVAQATAASLNATVVGTGTFLTQAAQSGSWAVTANAGTNLNTSALALETGGHLAAIDGKVPALGQALAAGSVPVVLTAAQLTTLTPLSTVAVTQSGTWSDTVTQATAANLNATVVGTGTFAVQATQSGTWNIGTVTTLPSIPAGTNLIGQVSGSGETSTVYSGTTALTPKFAMFSTSSSGATTVVALVNGKRLRVLRWRCTANGATNVKWQSHVTPTDISGLAYLTQFAAAGGAYCPVGHFQTVSGEALDINNSNSVAISGEVTYIEV